MTSIDDLKNLVDYHDDLYYNHDNPELSDEEYDNLKAQYLRRVLMGETVVPGDASDKFSKVAHLSGIKSLEKINTDAEVIKAIDYFEEGDVTVKLDGLTIVVYGRGTLYPYSAVWATRGNGSEGEDVSHTCAKVPGLKAVDGIIYRCEVYMPKSEFEAINKDRIANGLEPFKNPRNAAAGMIRNLDANKVRGLRYLAYRIIDSPLKHTEQLELLNKHGIKTVPCVKFDKTSSEQAVKFITSYSELYRDKLPMEIDGLVIQSDREDSISYYGETGHHPKDAVAYKFSSQGQWTKLTDVLWQVSRMGQVTPVGVFEPVSILGSTITKATLHNVSYIRALDLKIGSSIHVIKANDVIPRIAKIRETNDPCFDIEEPNKCPVCLNKLSKVNDTLFCDSLTCSAKIIAQVAHMAKKDALNIDGLSTKTIEKLFDRGLLDDKYDIFDLSVRILSGLDGFTEHSAQKLVSTIEKARFDVPFDKFLYATGVPLLGRRVSKDIAKVYNNVNDFIYEISVGKFDKIKAIPGIGDEICTQLSHGHSLVSNLSAYCTIQYNDTSRHTTSVFWSNPYNFVITGALVHGTRAQYESMINASGHCLQSSVNKKTDYLVTNDNERTTKRIKAEQLGVKIITETEFLEVLKK